MTKEEKREMFRPRMWHLYENGVWIDTLFSHKEAKRVKHRLTVEAYRDCLDLTYTIKKA